jgi:hypothetical protein
MCFYNDDADWTANVNESSTYLATTSAKCMECRRVIAVGETVHQVYQQEADDCLDCENGDCECADGGTYHVCQCDKPELGHTYTWLACADCFKFLAAVEAAEVADGCSKSEARPPLGQLIEELAQQAAYDGGDAFHKYGLEAAKLHPELVRNGYLAFLRSKVFRVAGVPIQPRGATL